MHLEHLGDSLVRGGHRWWMVSMAGTRVWLGFIHPPGANGTDDLMPRSVVSKLCCRAPMNWGTLWVLASSKIDVPNTNRMWSLENEIGYFRPQHDCTIVFNVSLIAPMSSKLWPSEDRPQYALRAPWRLFSKGWPWMMKALWNWNKGVTRVQPPIWS